MPGTSTEGHYGCFVHRQIWHYVLWNFLQCISQRSNFWWLTASGYDVYVKPFSLIIFRTCSQTVAGYDVMNKYFKEMIHLLLSITFCLILIPVHCDRAWGHAQIFNLDRSRCDWYNGQIRPDMTSWRHEQNKFWTFYLERSSTCCLTAATWWPEMTSCTRRSEPCSYS